MKTAAASLSLGMLLFACKSVPQAGDNSEVLSAEPGRPSADLYNAPPLSEAQRQKNDQAIQEVIKLTTNVVTRNLNEAKANEPSSDFDKKPMARRDTHTKTHGCLKGTLTVKADIEATYATGLFAKPNKSYPAIMRFANGQGKILPDAEPDARGMAMKIFDPEGPRPVVLDQNTQSQTFDFVTNNAPIFFVKGPVDYYDFLRAAADASSKTKLIWKFLISGQSKFWSKAQDLAALKKVIARDVVSPLSEMYWSGSPSRMGSVPVKYVFKPCGGVKTAKAPKNASLNYLREAMIKDVEANKQSHCFDMYAQTLDVAAMNDQTKVSTLMEDTTIDWETDSKAKKFIAEHPIATIAFPAQRFSSDEDLQTCENLSFNVWRTTVEHQPLGELNRMRKVVYTEVSKLRHGINNIAEKEPSAQDFVPNTGL